MMVRDEKRREKRPGAVLVGGRVGKASRATGYRLDRKFAEEVVPGVIATLTGFLLDDRFAGESFGDQVDRTGVDEMQHLADEAAGVGH